MLLALTTPVAVGASAASAAEIHRQDGLITLRGETFEAAFDQNHALMRSLRARPSAEAPWSPNLLATGAEDLPGASTWRQSGRFLRSSMHGPAPAYTVRRSDLNVCLIVSGFNPECAERWLVTLGGAPERLVWRVTTACEDASPVETAYPGFRFATEDPRTRVQATIWPGSVERIERSLPLPAQRPRIDWGFPLAGYDTATLPAATYTIHLASNQPTGCDLEFTTTGPLTVRNRQNHWTRVQAGADRSGTSQVTLGVLPPFQRGTQLPLDLPDPVLARRAAGMYDEMLNAGSLADMNIPIFGNQPGGWYFAMTLYTYAYAVYFGTEREHLPSERSATGVLREALASLLDSTGPSGEVLRGGMAGTNHENEASMLIAAHKYVLKTRDRAFAVRYLPALRGCADFLDRSAVDGLLTSPEPPVDADPMPFSYWDTIHTQGSCLFPNVLWYQSLRDLSELEGFAGTTPNAASRQAQAEALRRRILDRFWSENRYTHGGFSDRISPRGLQVANLHTAGPLLAIAFGLTSPERSRRLLASMDAELKRLRAERHWQGWGIPCNLLDAASEIKRSFGLPRERGFGGYMNGGIFPEWTGWEIVARAKAGDATGAENRARAFFLEYERHHYFEGTNSWTIDGKPNAWIGEPFLSTQVLVPAAVAWSASGRDPSFEERTFSPLTFAPPQSSQPTP